MDLAMVIPIIVVLLAAFAWGVSDYFHAHISGEDGSGWIYFISDGPGTPVKIGMSQHDPEVERLADLQTGNPTPLRVLYKFHVRDRRWAERTIHDHLADARIHGEWFDRDSTLAFISYLKGEY